MTDSMAEVRAARKKPLSAWAASPNREIYIRLIEEGWSSTSLEHYADYRFHEKIPASTFRNHMRRIEKKAGKPITAGKFTDKDGKPMETTDVDVMGVRQSLIVMQMQRIGMDFQHEQAMNKLFNTTRQELQLLSSLLTEAKQDQLDFGARVAPDQEPLIPEGPASAPKHRSFGELLGLPPEADELAAVERLAAVIEMPARSA